MFTKQNVVLIGHERLQQFFQRAVREGSLSHAYCFVGPAGVGKRTLARELAFQLLQVAENKLDQHPDFITLERREDAKSGKLKKDIIIEQARDLRDRLGRTAWLGGYQVVIIDGAEQLNAASANALLKSLEEPPSQMVFFLITDNEALLLPTIRSRTQLFYFSLVPASLITSGLVASGVGVKQAEIVARLSLGRVGVAKALLAPDTLTAQTSERARCSELMAVPLYQRLTIIESLTKVLAEGEYGREQVQTILEQWSLVVRDQLLLELGQEKFAAVTESRKPGANPKRLQEQLDRITRVRQLVRQNINTRLALEELCLHF